MELKFENKPVSGINIAGKEVQSINIGGKDFSFIVTEPEKLVAIGSYMKREIDNAVITHSGTTTYVAFPNAPEFSSDDGTAVKKYMDDNGGIGLEAEIVLDFNDGSDSIHLRTPFAKVLEQHDYWSSYTKYDLYMTYLVPKTTFSNYVVTIGFTRRNSPKSYSNYGQPWIIIEGADKAADKVSVSYIDQPDIAKSKLIGGARGLSIFKSDKLAQIYSNHPTYFAIKSANGKDVLLGASNYGLVRLKAEGTFVDEETRTGEFLNGWAFTGSDGKLYLGTYRRGVQIYDETTKTYTTVYGGDVSKGFGMEVADGTMYFGTYSNGLIKYSGGTTTSVSGIDMTNGFMYQLKDGTIYVGTYDSGLYKLENDALVRVSTTDVGTGAMLEASDGTIYVATKGSDGVMKLENDSLVDWVSGIYTGNTFLHEEPDGSLYVGTNQGLAKYVESTKTFQLVNNKISVINGFWFDGSA